MTGSFSGFTKVLQIHRWLLHPVFMFIFSVVALSLSLFLYIYWYIKVSTGLKSVVRRFDIDPGQILEAETWMVILVLSILVGIILVGILTIFVYGQKTLQLYRVQHNFINNFTHELRTPVTSLKLYLETFAKYELSRDEQLKYIEYMLHDIMRLSENINRILNLARIEARSYSGEFVPHDLVEIISQFCDNNRHLFQGCEIAVLKPDRSYSHLINVPLFEMLLMNLLTNAIKYNHSETPRIEISFEIRNRRIHIRFRDNGIGIEKKQLKKIFGKFYQIGRSDNMSAKGSGLGLHLVWNIARLHKGKVIAESPGRGMGATFVLILPL